MTETQTALPPGPLAPDELRRLHAWWRAANYLSVGQIYLLDNPLLREPLRIEHVKPRLLGHWGTTPGSELRLRAPQPRHPRQRPRRHLRHRARARRSRPRGQHLPRGYLHRGLSQHHARRGGPPAAVPPVLLPRRDSEPRGAGDAGLDPRGRRARLRARPCLRRGVRQPRPARLLRRGRRRGRDRPAGGELAFQQVREPGARRRGASGPASQRLQDRQPDRSGAHPARRAARAARGLRPRALLRGGRRPGDHAPAHGRDTRPGGQRHRRHPGACSRRRHRAAALADDRPAHAKGLDGTQGGRRPADGGHLPRPPGPAGEARRATPSISPRSRRGCAHTARRSCSTRTGGSPPRSRRWRPRARDAWAPTRTRTAGCCCAT